MYFRKLYEEMQKSTSEDFESQSNSKDRKTILKGMGNIKTYVKAAYQININSN